MSLRACTVGMVVALAAAGCTGATEPPPDELPIDGVPALPLALTFKPIELGKTDALTELTVSDAVIVGGGQPMPAGFRILLRESQDLRGSDFAVLVDAQGQPLERPTCGNADHGGLIQNEHGLFHVATLDCQPGGVWISRMGRAADGRLGVVSTRPVDVTGVHGVAGVGRGSITPWQTALIASHAEANAARIAPSGKARGEPVGDYDPERIASFHVPAHRPYVYDHGWVIEVDVSAPDGSATAHKRYAMGRFAHGIARVMPDRRTVYLTDDTTNGGLFLFLADTAGDLSAGTLYVARFEQEDGAMGGRGKLSWANLGHATDAQIEAVLASGTLHFDELFESQPDGEAPPGQCLEGYFLMRDAWGVRCERPVRKHTNPVVHRLETRRSAIGARATLELRQAGSIVHDPDHDVLYLSVGRIDRGMGEASVQWDLPGEDDMRFRENRCGGVYSLDLVERPKDVDDKVMDSPYVAVSLRGFILGRPDGYRCSTDTVANPDDLAYLPGSGTLLIAEGAEQRPNNLLWAVDVAALHGGGLASMTPIAAAPPGGELSGMEWFVDIDGQGYLTTTVQHPWRDHPDAIAQPAEARVSAFGLWGPFPRLVPPAAPQPPAPPSD